jgi:hypothetical protein
LAALLLIKRSARRSGRDPRFDDAMDQTLCSFNKGQMVSEAAFKQHADTMVAGNVGGGHQRHVFCRTHMIEVISLRQNEKPFGFW